MSQGSQFYLRQSSVKPKTQTSLDERRKKAENLINQIMHLRKPQRLEAVVSLTDGQKLIQVLLNTQHIEIKTN